jgi:hypothetical protein
VEILNLGGASEESIPPRLKSRRNKKLKIAAGIGSLAAVTGLGSTLAASITLNNNGPVEFGQGVATTAACNGEDPITLTPTSEYVPSTESFRLSGVTLSGINTDAPDPYTGIGCAGKTLIVHAYTDEDGYASFAVDSNKANPLFFSYGDFGGTNHLYDAVAVTIGSDGNIDSLWANTTNNPDNTNWWDIYINAIDSNTTKAFTIELNRSNANNPGLDSRAVSKFTVESIDTPSGGLGTSGDWYEMAID